MDEPSPPPGINCLFLMIVFFIIFEGVWNHNGGVDLTLKMIKLFPSFLIWGMVYGASESFKTDFVGMVLFAPLLICTLWVGTLWIANKTLIFPFLPFFAAVGSFFIYKIEVIKSSD